MQLVLLIILWIAFGISHSYLVSEGFMKWIRKLSGRYYSYYRLLYNLISLATFALFLYFTKQIDSHIVIIINPIIQIILLSFSTLIILWSLFTFDVLEFIGVRQVISLYSNKVKTRNDVWPFKSGLYGVVRHPMYSATIVFMWSLNSTLAEIIMKIILTIYIVVGAILEERKLVQEYGMTYIKYQRAVPMLIPLLKKIHI